MSSIDSNLPWVIVLYIVRNDWKLVFMKNMRLVPLAIDLLDLCELLPCIGSRIVFQVPWAYYGCWDLVFEVFTLIMRFLHFWADECSLKRAQFA